MADFCIRWGHSARARAEGRAVRLVPFVSPVKEVRVEHRLGNGSERRSFDPPRALLQGCLRPAWP